MTMLYVGWGLGIFLFIMERLFPIVTRPCDWKQRWHVNLIGTILLSMSIGVTMVGGATGSQLAEKYHLGIFQNIKFPFWLMVILTFLARSLLGWVLHYYHHRIPMLWRFHLVHHSDHFIDVTTSGRFHFLESFIGASGSFLLSIAMGISLEITMIFEVSWIIWNNLAHANMQLPATFERLANKVFHTPANHRVHHSIYPEDYGRNYGVVLSVWDHLFGTYKAKVKDESELRVGIASIPPAEAQDLGKIIFFGYKSKI